MPKTTKLFLLPVCDTVYGYTTDTLKTVLPYYSHFEKWMSGRTLCEIDGKSVVFFEDVCSYIRQYHKAEPVVQTSIVTKE